MTQAEMIQLTGEVLTMREQLIAKDARIRNLEIANYNARAKVLMIRESLNPDTPRYNAAGIAIDILDAVFRNDSADDAIVVELADELRRLAVFIYARDVFHDADSKIEWIQGIEDDTGREFPRLRELIGGNDNGQG